MTPSPSKYSLFEKSIKLSFLNIWRNKFLSIATIFVIGTIIFIFNVILAVNFISKDALEDLSKKIDVVLYLKEITSYEDSQNLIKDIQALEGVQNAIYTSKEDALMKIKTTHPDISIAFEKYNLGNPLPASINITTSHPKYHEDIATFLTQDKYKIYLSNISTNSDSTNNAILTSVSKNLLEVTNFAQQIIFWMIIIFVIGGALIILNALQITIFHRRKEIDVMKLVGASHLFIRLPFIIESIIYGVAAVFLSYIMLFILSQNIPIQTDIQFYKIFLIELFATIFLSTLSSQVAVHEYLK